MLNSAAENEKGKGPIKEKEDDRDIDPEMGPENSEALQLTPTNNSINGNPALSSNSTKILKYIQRSMDPKVPVSKGRLLLPTLAGMGLGVAAGIPYVPGGLQVGGKNRSLGYTFAASGFGINLLLYAPFSKNVIEILLRLFSNPEELDKLIVRKISPGKYILAIGVLGNFAILSILPYIGLSEETNSPGWILPLNITANFIAHLESFRLAAGNENFMFHRHFFEPLKYGALSLFSTSERRQQYLDTLKYEFILSDLHKKIFRNFKKLLAKANWEKKFEKIKAEKPETLSRKIAGGVAGFSATLMTFITLAGYLLGTYLVIPLLLGPLGISPLLTLVLAPILTSLANFFFLYLVGRSTFDMGDSVLGMAMDIGKDGLRNYDFPAWFQMHAKKLLGILAVSLVMAALSFASSIDLIDQNFAAIGLGDSWLLPVVKFITYIATGFFNSVGLPTFLKMSSEAVTLVKNPPELSEKSPLLGGKPSSSAASKRPTEREIVAVSERPTEREIVEISERPTEREIVEASERHTEREIVAVSKKKPTEREIVEQMFRDYKGEMTLGQLSRLPKKDFLLFFLEMVRIKYPEEIQNAIVWNFSNKTLKDTDELDLFLNHRNPPSAYERTSPFFFNRTFQRNSGVRISKEPEGSATSALGV